MTIRRLIVWITFLSVFAMAARISVDTDTWWHLRTGTWILENGAIPAADPFSYTRAGEDWRIPGWLVQVPMAWMHAVGGPGLLNLWVAGMVVLAFALLWPVLEGGPFTRAFIVILGAAAAGVYWAARPYMVTFVLAAAFLRILEDWRFDRADRLWWLPVLMVVWANSHGGFAVGVIIYGVYVAGRVGEWANGRVGEWANGRMGEWANGRGGIVSVQLKEEGNRDREEDRRALGKLLIVGLVMVAAVTLSPAGPVMLLYPFQTVSIESLQDFIQEWQSPNFHERQVWPFAAMIFLLVGAVGRSGRRLDLEDFLLVAGWGFLGLLAGRNIATFALAGSVVLSRHAAPVLQGWQAALGLRMNPDRDPGRLFGAVNDVLVILLLILVVAKAASVYPEAVNREAFEKFLPVEAVEFIREAQPEGRLFNSYNWGAYLLWALPEYPVFVDGRTDLYDDEVISQWFRVVRAEAGWEADLAAWDVRLVLIEPGSPLAGALERGGWERVYVDPVAAVFTR